MKLTPSSSHQDARTMILILVFRPTRSKWMVVTCAGALHPTCPGHFSCPMDLARGMAASLAHHPKQDVPGLGIDTATPCHCTRSQTTHSCHANSTPHSRTQGTRGQGGVPIQCCGCPSCEQSRDSQESESRRCAAERMDGAAKRLDAGMKPRSVSGRTWPPRPAAPTQKPT